MLRFTKSNFDKKNALNELIQGDGVIIVEDVFDNDIINRARLVVNEFAENQEQKESHFNAEAETSGKIKLQQRVWNLFGKDLVFSDLITHDLIFDLMSKFLGTEFFCGSYCASRLLPGSLGQELHIDYPYWDYYNKETFPMGLNSSFPQIVKQLFHWIFVQLNLVQQDIFLVLKKIYIIQIKIMIFLI